MRHVRILLFAVVLASPLVAQERLISGKVVSVGDLASLPGVTVSLVPKACDCSKCLPDCKCCPASFVTVTDTEGLYRFSNIPEGEYTIQAELSGLKAGRESVTVSNDTKVKTDFQMAWETVVESITVTAEAPLVDVTVNAYEIGGKRGDAVEPLAAVFREQGCSCTRDCPDDPKCDCCLAFATRIFGGRLTTQLPAGKSYDVYLATSEGTSETKFKLDRTGTSLKLNIPFVRDPD